MNGSKKACRSVLLVVLALFAAPVLRGEESSTDKTLGVSPAEGDENSSQAEKKPSTGDENPSSRDEHLENPDENSSNPIEASSKAPSSTPAQGFVVFDQEVSGFVRVDYRGRADDDESDHDARAVGGLDWGRASEDQFSLHLVASLDADLGARSARHRTGQGIAPTRFLDLSDAGRERVRTLLLEGHVQARDLMPGFTLRGGRLPLNEGIAPLYDGGEVAWEEDALRAFGFAGVPVHYYESSRAGDFTAGGGAGYRFGAWLDMDALYVHLTDADTTTNLSGFRDEDRDDGFAQLRLKSRPIEHLRLFGEIESLEWKLERANLRAGYEVIDLDLDVQVHGTLLRLPRRDYTTPFGSFWDVQGELSPYWEAGVSAFKGIGEHLWAEAGFTARELRKERDEGSFNHGFMRAFGAAGLEDLGLEGLSVSATLDWWEGNDKNTRIALSGDLGYELTEDWDLTLFSRFDRFRYDLLQERETQNVRSFGTATEYRVGDTGFAIEASYEIEDEKGARYQLWRFGLGYDF